MTLSPWLAGLLAAATMLLAAPPPAWARDCNVGVNVNSFQNFSAADQETIVEQLVSSGVRCVRTSLRPDDKNIHLARELQDKGIGLVLVPGAEFLPGAPLRPADAKTHMRSAMPLSWADPERSRAYYQSLFDRLDANGIVLAGVELGNEINWTDFNGDFPVPGQGKAFTLQDLSRDPEAQKVARGFLQYLKVLAALKDVRDHSRLNRQTPIISAGMAAVTGGAWQQKLGVDGVSIPATYAYLRAHGLDTLVDGYGVHDYPPVVQPGDKAAAAQRQAGLDSNIFPPGNTKPYWLTEWGFSSTAASSNQDQARARSVAEMRAYFDQLFRQGRLSGIFWYVWNEPDHDSIYRNGALLDAGKRAIAPMPPPGPQAGRAGVIGPRPCDIYAAGHTPCISAHSTVRSLYTKYTGALYQVKRASDNDIQNIGQLSDGYANAATQDTFCKNTTCVITRIYDQSPQHNDLTISPGGRYRGPGLNGSDLGAAADTLPITAGGHQVYGVSVSPGMGYRNNRTSGVAVRGRPEGMYMVSSGAHLNSGCCFDYGNAETSGTDTGVGHMDAVNVSRDLEWPNCRNQSAPGLGADLENGIFHWSQRSCNPAANFSGGPRPFISAWLKNDGQTRFALKWGDARSGGLNVAYSGALPQGYAPMRQEGAIILGIGGDNSHASAGSFFEGVMTAGFPTDSADSAVQSNIVAVGYGAPTGLAGTLTPGSEISLRATTACCTGDYIRNRNGAAVIAPVTPGSAEQDKGDSTWIVRRGLANSSCVSFESKDSPGDFLRQQNFGLHVQPIDGVALNRSDATFCPQPGKSGKGTSFHSVNDPTKYIRHYDGKVYVASDGDSANSWDNAAHWTDDVSFIVSPPWSP
jgi:non-reducing end alpha-L-arabinofuranosidase